MVRKETSYQCSVFGDDAERYLASLFLLSINPHGSRRPDLLSNNGLYRPKLSIEVKSGLEKGKKSKRSKGVMVSYQLHYAITSQEDYAAILPGERLRLTGLLFDQLLESVTPTAYYYALIARTDGLRSDDLVHEYSPVRMRWGNVFLSCSPKTLK